MPAGGGSRAIGISVDGRGAREPGGRLPLGVKRAAGVRERVHAPLPLPVRGRGSCIIVTRVTNELHQQAFDTLDGWVGEPAGGLPEDFFLFLSRYTPLINVDLLIQDDRRRTLLTWREDETYGAGWHVPGGIIRYKETAEERIRATAQRELGTDVAFGAEPMAIVQAIEPDRRERGHFISMVYRCRLTGPPDPALAHREGAPRRDQWAWHESCPPDLIPAQAVYRRFF
ncbi:MAG: hydrolase [Candidatus Solibacter sp.]|nr:hydrolase [Candidatus Solibacter sp.]